MIMELNLKFNADNQKELKILKAIGAALMVVGEKLSEETEVPSENSEEPPVENPVVEEKPSDEQPKKRAPRKKKEESQPVVAEEPRPVTEEEPHDSERPFDEPVSEPAPKHEGFPTMSKDEWSEINHAKRDELGLTVGGEHGELIRDFNVYCQKSSELAFGNPKPSTLSGEELYRFAQWFKTIELNPDYVPGSADDEHGYPFVSDVLSKE